ncbi:formate/nitrite transporter family protein [Geitlerinema sp. CS-897]|nr:formate/nitrite transporter family protein [Geitlerinema sp. CS-897]
MDYNAPPELVAAAVKAGENKARLSVKNLLMRGFYSGTILGIGITLAVTTMVQTQIPVLGAIIFPWAFCSIVIFGMELVTGNFALMTTAMLARRTNLTRSVRNWLWVYLGNFLGCAFAAFLISFSLSNGGTLAEPNAVAEKLMAIAIAKSVAVREMGAPGFMLFIVRGILCNLLVCVAVLLGIASKSVPGKILGCWFPIATFVALGLEHIVVNMYFLNVGVMLGAPISAIDMVFWDYLPVTIGNLIGGGLFVGCLFYATHNQQIPLRPTGLDNVREERSPMVR